MPWSITWARGSLFMYLLAVPWLPSLTSLRTGHDVSRGLQLLLWTVCGLALWHRRGVAATPPRTAVLALVLLLAALGLSARAPQPGWALMELALWVGLVAAALLVADVVREGGRWREALGWTLLVAAVLQGGLEVTLALLGLLQGIAPTAGLLGLGYDNLRFLNHVQTLSLPLTVAGAVWAGDSRPARQLTAVALACGGAVLWASGGRATELGLLIGLVLVVLAGQQSRAPLLRRLLPGLGASLLLYGLVWQALPSALGLATQGTTAVRLLAPVNDQARWVLWADAWQQWWAHPMLGIGPMHLAAAPSRYAMHPHQWPLQWLAEWGGLLAGAVLVLMATWLVAQWRAWRRATASAAEPARTACLLAVLASLVDAQFSGNAVMPVSQVWLAVAWGALMGAGATAAPVASAPWVGSVVRLSRALVLLIVMSAAGLTAVQWPSLEERLKQSLADGQAPRTQPRFWSHGRLTPL